MEHQLGKNVLGHHSKTDHGSYLIWVALATWIVGSILLSAITTTVALLRLGNWSGGINIWFSDFVDNLLDGSTWVLLTFGSLVIVALLRNWMPIFFRLLAIAFVLGLVGFSMGTFMMRIKGIAYIDKMKSGFLFGLIGLILGIILIYLVHTFTKERKRIRKH